MNVQLLIYYAGSAVCPMPQLACLVIPGHETEMFLLSQFVNFKLSYLADAI